MDHRVPLVRGGRSVRSNLVPACRACNAAKKYLLPVEWAAYLARLADEADRNPVDNRFGPSVGCARVDRGYTAPSRSDPDGRAGRSGSSRGPAVGGRFSVAGAWARVVGAPRKEVVQP